MKLYKNLVNAVALILQDIFSNNVYADKAIEKKFKQNAQWGSRDRKFVAEAVYDIVRHYRLYEHLAESKNNFWFMTSVWCVLKKIDLPDWPEFKHVNEQDILLRHEALKSEPLIYYSYPDWLWQCIVNELGADTWNEQAMAMNEQAEVYLRTNTLKIDRQKLLERLKLEKIEAAEITEAKDALVLVKRQNVFKTKLFAEGCFEVQDIGSQMIASFLNPSSQDFVIDACAGAGGKSLHLAALMKNKGKIISLDVADYKLNELRRRAKRAGVSTIETRIIENDQSIEALKNKADKLLLDVPCSGLGVLKRNPDTKWKLKPESIESTKLLQSKILSNYSGMIKVNGELVYSTCSILPSENGEQVKKFVLKNPNFVLVKEKTILPSDGGDGFYMALIKRTK